MPEVGTALLNILQHGTRSNMTREQILRSVARQVAASQRLAGVDVTPAEVLAILLHPGPQDRS